MVVSAVVRLKRRINEYLLLFLNKKKKKEKRIWLYLHILAIGTHLDESHVVFWSTNGEEVTK